MDSHSFDRSPGETGSEVMLIKLFGATPKELEVLSSAQWRRRWISAGAASHTRMEKVRFEPVVPERQVVELHAWPVLPDMGSASTSHNLEATKEGPSSDRGQNPWPS